MRYVCQKKPEEVKKVISDAVEKTKSKVKKAAAKNTGCSIFTQQNLNDSIQVYITNHDMMQAQEGMVVLRLVFVCAVEVLVIDTCLWVWFSVVAKYTLGLFLTYHTLEIWIWCTTGYYFHRNFQI